MRRILGPVSAVILLALTPLASADWTPLYQFSPSEGRVFLDWSVGPEGEVSLVTKHEDLYVVLEEIDENGHRNSTLVRKAQAVERAAVVAYDGKKGVLYSENASKDVAKKNWNPEIHGLSPDDGLWFAWQLDKWTVDRKRLAPEPFAWDAFVQNATTGTFYFLKDGNVSSLAKSSVPTAPKHSYQVKGFNATRSKLVLGEAGDAHGVLWGNDGAFYLHSKPGVALSQQKMLKLTNYWDFMGADVAYTDRGEIGILLGERRDACQLFRGVPTNDASWTSRRINQCPLGGGGGDYFADFTIPTPEDYLVLTRRDGFWRDDRGLQPFTCSRRTSALELGADDVLYLVGDGPSLWKETPDPRIEFVSTPRKINVTEKASFDILNNMTELKGKTYLWEWGDGRAEGSDANVTMSHAYTVRGNYTVNLTVQRDACAIGSGLRASYVLEVVEPPPPSENETGLPPLPPDNSTVQGDGGKDSPAWGALGTLGAALGVAFARRRATKR